MKRFFDFSLAFFLLLFLIPLIIILSIIIRVTSKDSILYWSSRVGINNQLFSMPKFRSMNASTPDIASHLIMDPNEYLTKLGRFLRNTSLDEIPQLYSILKGDMSFVGPRPALYNQDDLIALRTKKGIHLMKPGLTGLAQINGRDNLSISQKILLDLEYMEKRTFLLDIQIIWRTFLKVLFQNGISH